MRILRLIHTLDPRTGGPVQGILDVQPYLHARGVEVEVISADSADAPWLREARSLNGLECFPLGELNNGFAFSRRWDEQLEERIGEADAVVVHGLWKYFLTAARRACERAEKPLFVYPHGMLDPWFDRRYPLKAIKKRLYWHLVEKRNLSGARKLLFTAPEEERYARQHWRLEPSRNGVLPYGVEAPLVEGDVAEGFAAHSDGERRLLFLGRVVEKKGVDLLVRAFREKSEKDPQRNGRLIIAGPVGDSKWLRRLRTEAAGSNWPVEFRGAVFGEEKWRLIRSCEALCLPSHQENFGRVVAEALSQGRPVLLSEAVNIASSIVDAGAGWAEADTLEGVHRLLQHWLDCNPETLEAMGGRAHNCFVERFSAQSAAEALYELFDFFCNGEHTRSHL